MHLSLKEADKIMLRYGHTGLPVLEDGKVVGVISRRDVDKARLHRLEHSPVKGYMARQVVSVPSDTPSVGTAVSDGHPRHRPAAGY